MAVRRLLLAMLLVLNGNAHAADTDSHGTPAQIRLVSEAWLDLFDQRMEALVRSGELRPIFGHWKQPYPFPSGSQPY